MQKTTNNFHLSHFAFHLGFVHLLSFVVFSLLLSSSRWFSPSLPCRLAIFCLVVLLISSLSLVATLCSVWSTYCLSFLRYFGPSPLFCFGVYSIKSIIFVLFLISEYGILSCSLRPNIFSVLSLFVSCLLRDHIWQP